MEILCLFFVLQLIHEKQDFTHHQNNCRPNPIIYRGFWYFFTYLAWLVVNFCRNRAFGYTFSVFGSDQGFFEEKDQRIRDRKKIVLT